MLLSKSIRSGRRGVAGLREILVAVLDVAIAGLAIWFVLVRSGILYSVHELELLGFTWWVPGLRPLLPLVALRGLLTPGLASSLGIHRRRWAWSVAAGVVALSAAGAGYYCGGPEVFPAGRQQDLAVIRDGYLRLYRHYPEYGPAFTRPQLACALDTYPFMTVGREPYDMRLSGRRAAAAFEVLYSYVNWQQANDPAASLRLRDAPPAAIEVSARPAGSTSWEVIARADIDPTRLWSKWFEGLPPGYEWLEWMSLTASPGSRWPATGDIEVRISATGPGAEYVVVAGTDELSEQPTQPAPEAPQRVILVSLDTLAADHVGHLGYSRDTTPRLDAFAEQNVTFSQAMCAAPWTMPSHWSLLTGLMPAFHGMCSKDSVPTGSAITLAGELRDRGYRTAAVTGGYYVSTDWGMHLGFDYFREVWHTWVPPDDFRKDVELNVLHSIRWMDAHRDEPFFLFVHTYQPHDPMLRVHTFDDERTEPRLDADTGEVYFPDVLQREALRYDSEIRYTDRWLGHLLDWLETEGLLAESLVIVTSDHGENFRMDSLQVESKAKARGHGYAYYEDDVHVPLVVHFPESWNLPAPTVDTPVSLVDVYWTILAATGVPAEDLPEIPAMGKGLDLLPMVRDPATADPNRVIPIEANLPRPHGLALRTRDYKFVRNRIDNGGSPQVVDTLFELTTDPRELIDRSGDLPQVTQTFLEYLEDYLLRATHSPLGQAADRPIRTAALDKRTLRELESIGYVE